MERRDVGRTQVCAWWEKTPEANVAIACGPSNLAVLDVDHGLPDAEAAQVFARLVGGNITYAVRTGRRPEFGIQFYYDGAIPDVGLWKLHGCEGQIKSAGGYVMAAGSIHPDSKEAYSVWNSTPVQLLPLSLRDLKPERAPSAADDGEPITSNRNVALTRIAGKLRNAGLSQIAIQTALETVNAERCVPPLGNSEIASIASHAAAWKLPEAAPQVTLGGVAATFSAVAHGGAETSNVPIDWRTRYLTFEQVRDAKPTEFLIDGFLALGSITALAAPVAQRKSLIALNVAHALCTGAPLFDYFAVEHRPERVVYLCPEMGLASFSTRLKQIGLAEHVGTSLFCQTMDDERHPLSDLDGELPGAVVIIDTLTRFVEGDQNSADAMSKFADVIFELKRKGATVLLLHHSVKGAAGSGLSLDSALRGSTELAAFVTCCWATSLRDPDDPYKSPSRLVNVKQRDFESKPFEVVADETCKMRIVGVPGSIAEIKVRAGAQAEAALAQILEESPSLGINKLQDALRAAGHKKGGPWITKARAAILGGGVTLVG